MEHVIDWVGAAWAHREEILAWIATVILALSALVRVLQAGAHALARWAATTATTSDDEPARTLVRWADAAAHWLDRARRLVRPLSLHGRGDAPTKRGRR